MAFELTDENFKDYFFKAKEDYKPEKGQVLAKWCAKADFVDGWVKRNVIEMLCSAKSGAETSLKVMMKLVNATEKDAIRVLREMAEDLKIVPIDLVAAKPYRFTVEQFYWTKKEYIPEDPHWSVVSCIDLRDVKVESNIQELLRQESESVTV